MISVAGRFFLWTAPDDWENTTASFGFKALLVWRRQKSLSGNIHQPTLVFCCSLAATTVTDADERFGSSRFDLRLTVLVDVIAINRSRSRKTNLFEFRSSMSKKPSYVVVRSMCMCSTSRERTFVCFTLPLRVEIRTSQSEWLYIEDTPEKARNAKGGEEKWFRHFFQSCFFDGLCLFILFLASISTSNRSSFPLRAIYFPFVSQELSSFGSDSNDGGKSIFTA